MNYIFTRRFAMAHRLILGVGGKCAVPHGHNEDVRVVCEPTSVFETGPNMSMDFGTAKGIWHEWIDTAVDHAFQLGDSDPLVQYFLTHERHYAHRLLVTPGDPTTEMLCMLMWRKFRALCGDALELKELAIVETPTNTVTLSIVGAYPSIKPVWDFINAPSDPSKWWDRPDLTINDLSV